MWSVKHVTIFFQIFIKTFVITMKAEQALHQPQKMTQTAQATCKSITEFVREPWKEVVGAPAGDNKWLIQVTLLRRLVMCITCLSGQQVRWWHWFCFARNRIGAPSNIGALEFNQQSQNLMLVCFKRRKTKWFVCWCLVKHELQSLSRWTTSYS